MLPELVEGSLSLGSSLLNQTIAGSLDTTSRDLPKCET